MKLAETAAALGWTRWWGVCAAFVRGSCRGLWVERRSGVCGGHEHRTSGAQGPPFTVGDPTGHLCALRACVLTPIARGCRLPAGGSCVVTKIAFSRVAPGLVFLHHDQFIFSP